MLKDNVLSRCLLRLGLILSTGCERNPAKSDDKKLIPSQMTQADIR